MAKGDLQPDRVVVCHHPDDMLLEGTMSYVSLIMSCTCAWHTFEQERVTRSGVVRHQNSAMQGCCVGEDHDD